MGRPKWEDVGVRVMCAACDALGGRWHPKIGGRMRALECGNCHAVGSMLKVSAIERDYTVYSKEAAVWLLRGMRPRGLPLLQRERFITRVVMN